MFTLVPRDGGCFSVLDSGADIGRISTHYNPFHGQNCYLDLALARYDGAAAKELFRQLRTRLDRPLQVMLYAHELDKCAFLAAGGFQRKRRCYELAVSAADLKTPINACVPLMHAQRGSADYGTCCGLLYRYYAKTHQAVSPLTANLELFCRDLPDTAVFSSGAGGEIHHFAFVDGNEIAYTGTLRPSSFRPFAQSLLSQMFLRHEHVFFECDSSDLAAMELKELFRTPSLDSFDTYILD